MWKTLQNPGFGRWKKIKENKAKVARAYNKKVKPKEFQVGDLVWEAVLPLWTKDATYGKWSPNWHGPYRVDQALSDPGPRDWVRNEV
jgi:hypothetical protein